GRRRRGAGRLEARLRTHEPLLAATRERLAALPERERLLERRTALLERRHDLDELVTGLLVAEVGDVVGFGHGSHANRGPPRAPAAVHRGGRRSRRPRPPRA